MKKLLEFIHFLTLHLNLNMKRVVYGKQITGNRLVLKNTGRICLGNKVSLNSYPDGDIYRTGLLTHCKDSTISIGDNCILNGTMIHCRTNISIGSFCMFGPGTHIIDNDSHRISIKQNERRQPPYSAPIIIEDNVWVGMNSIILKGVKISNNSIVAAHSVVTKDIPENVLVAGNPAKIVKNLMK